MKVVHAVWVLVLSMVVQLAPAAEQTEIEDIRRKYTVIEAGKDWETKVIQVDVEEPGGMKITRYSGKDGDLVKMVVETMDDHGTSSESYYFDGGGLFFVFSSSRYWRFAGEGVTEDTMKECRLYFSGDKCVRFLVKEVKSKTPGTDFKPLLEKAENRDIQDPEEAKWFAERARALAPLTTEAALLTYLR